MAGVGLTAPALALLAPVRGLRVGFGTRTRDDVSESANRRRPPGLGRAATGPSSNQRHTVTVKTYPSRLRVRAQHSGLG